MAKIKAKAEFLPRRHSPALGYDRRSGPLHGGRLSEPREAITQAPESRRITTDLAPSVVEPSAASYSREISRYEYKSFFGAGLERALLEDVLGRVGLHFGNFEIVMRGGFRPEDGDAALEEMKKVDLRLKQRINSGEQELMASINRALGAIRLQDREEGLGLGDGESVRAEIRKWLSTLLLLPKGEMEKIIDTEVRGMVEHRAVGALSATDVALLTQMERLCLALNSGQRLDYYGDWSRRMDEIRKFSQSFRRRVVSSDEIDGRTLN
ncbi:MAG: hypothetical protein R3D31_12465 [Hyphomicrobiaceae bacterium]